MNTAAQERPILYFDGVCNLCNSVVQFIIRHDKKKQFLFASLQSAAGERAIKDISKYYDILPDSIILQYKGRYYVRSGAALVTAKLIGGGWSLLYGLMIVPRFIRDAVYNMVARNRYRWFGKKDACMMPTPELKERFL